MQAINYNRARAGPGRAGPSVNTQDTQDDRREKKRGWRSNSSLSAK